MSDPRSPASRFAVRRVLAAAALLAVVAAAAATAALADPLRWEVEPGTALVYEVSGAESKGATDGDAPFRTLYAADLRDARVPAEPVGRMQELLYHYAFQLPEAEVDRKLVWSVDDRHAGFPQNHGPVRVTGEAQARARGSKATVAWALELAGEPSNDPRRPHSFQKGTLTVQGVFHRKKGVLLQADFALVYDVETRSGSGTTTETRRVVGRLTLDDQVVLGDVAFQRRVDEAVAKALKMVLEPYLKRQEYARVGSQKMGHLALSLYAALHAGLEPTHGTARSAFADLAALEPEQTYSVALAILALEARSFQRVEPRRSRRRGATEARDRFKKGELDAADRALLEKLTAWLIAARWRGNGTWTYGAYEPGGHGGDHSNTQFAVLALHAAARSGVAIPREVWEEIARHFVKLQVKGPVFAPHLELEPGSDFGDAAGGADDDDDGADTGSRDAPGQRARERAVRARGFDYSVSGAWNAYASMSAAGASSLAIAYRWLRQAGAEAQLLARTRRGVVDGLAWLEKHHTMRHNWPSRGWPFYHLYSLEKAFEVTQVRTIGGHDWWAEGAHELLLRADPRGGWNNQNAVSTALAVLFLTRATQEPEIEVTALVRKGTGRREGDEAEAPDAVLIEGLGVVRVTDIIGALDTDDPDLLEERLELLDRAFAELEPDRRPLLLPALAERLDDRRRAVRKKAEELCRAICGERIKDADKARAVHAQWAEARAMGEAGDPTVVALLRARLENATAPCARRAIVWAIGRLGGVEAVPDLIDELEAPGDEADRAYVNAILSQLTGRDAGYDPDGRPADRARGVERWRAVWDEVKADLLAAEDLRRLVMALGDEARRADAERRLKAYGDGAVDALIAGLGERGWPGDGGARDRAIAALLESITGQAHGVDREAWKAWRRR